MRRLLIPIVLLLGAEHALSLRLPDDNFADGWSKAGKPLAYNRESLSDYIDGDAELFNEFSFQQLQVQQYKNGAEEVDLEMYEFGSPNGALGIYLLKCGRETPSPDIKTRNSVNSTQLLAVKGNYFVQVLNYSNGQNNVSVMIKLAQQAVASLAASPSSTILEKLPKDGMQPGTERIFCGTLSLQATCRLGKGDALQLRGKVYGATAKYNDVNRTTYSFAVVPYSDSSTAAAAFAFLLKNLDPGLQILDRAPTGFAFKDREAKYSLVELKNNTIELRFGLSHKPSRSAK